MSRGVTRYTPHLAGVKRIDDEPGERQAALRRGTEVDRLRPGVVQVEQQAAAEAFPDGPLHGMIVAFADGAIRRKRRELRIELHKGSQYPASHLIHAAGGAQRGRFTAVAGVV